MTVPTHAQFSKLISNRIPTIFSRLIFTFHFLSEAIFVEKRKPKVFGLKNAMEREIRKRLTFVTGQIASKIFQKIIIKALVISKRLKFF